MLAMVGFGIGEVLGGFFIGYVVDRFGSKAAIMCNLIIILSMFAVTLGFIEVFSFNWMAWVMCFLWGVQDSGVNTQVQEVLGFEFDNASSEPFSVYNILQCVGCFTF
jgi:MFS family permease